MHAMRVHTCRRAYLSSSRAFAAGHTIYIYIHNTTHVHIQVPEIDNVRIFAPTAATAPILFISILPNFLAFFFLSVLFLFLFIISEEYVSYPTS